jgi:excinuclease ABC subunit C
MYEVLARRLRRARDRHAGWELPELIVVDGGKQQLAMALAALRDVGVHPDDAPPDMVALAKERGGAAPPDLGPLRRPQARAAREVAVPDRVFLPHVKDAVRLRPNTAELFLVARVRDEAHRFAVTYHRQLRRRRALRSGLEDIPGIGPRRRQELLRALGSLRRIHGATVEELAAVPGMSLQAAEAVAAYFARPKGRAEGAGEDQEENKEQGTGNRAQGTTTGE